VRSADDGEAVRALIAAIRFLTRLPVPGPATRVEDLPAAVGWYPLVGAGVGAAIGGVFLALSHGLPAFVAAVLAIAVGLLLTGGFHEDGASDAADGLGGGFTTERVLTIMKDSRIGAYGAMALWVVLSLRVACLISLGGAAVPALMLAMAWGRWTAAPLTWLPALGAGLAKEITAAIPRWVPWLASFIAVVATIGAMHLGLERAPWAAIAAIMAALLWGAYLVRRLGGQSGDLLGAGNQLAEAAVLVALLWGHG
jgi:adenosylcobinamide-GDP ribazoletransferase